MANKGTESIRHLYNEIRNVPQKFFPYHLTVVARTFDALDNSVLTLFNAQKVIKSSISGSDRATYYFSSLVANLETSHARVPSTQNNDFTPSVLNVNAVIAPTISDAIFDVQVSVDDITWSSILQSPLHLPVGQKFATPTTVFSGTNIFRNNWTRAIVLAGSDLNAVGINIELDVLPI